jgi:hypothetical protein
MFLWFHTSESVTTVLCCFQTSCGDDLALDTGKTCWISCICKGKNSDRLSASEKHGSNESSIQNPKSTQRASTELGISITTGWRDLDSTFTRYSCCSTFQKRIGWELQSSVRILMLSWKTRRLIRTLPSAMKTHSIWTESQTRTCISGRLENSHTSAEFVCDLPKVNMSHALFRAKVYGLFFFAKATITSITYPDML